MFNPPVLRRSHAFVSLVFAASACSGDALEMGVDAGPGDVGKGDSSDDVRAGRLPAVCTSGTDADDDGLDDGEEQCLAQKHAPVLYMPFGKDWTRPSSAEWYLERADLRFAHDGGCPDQHVLSAPVDPAELITQWRHTRNNLVFGCNDQAQIVHAADGPVYLLEKFFLTAATPDAHLGADAAEAGEHWPIYSHVYRNSIGGINVQYWYFFPFNDNLPGFDHEGDWEYITIQLDDAGGIVGIWFAAHGLNNFVEEPELQFFGESREHPLVWIADGSHASYPSEAKCDSFSPTEGGADNCETNDHYRWFTEPSLLPEGEGGIAGAGVFDLGERGFESFNWARYCGVWGSIGQISPPPQTPVCKADRTWLRDAADDLL